MPGRPARHTRRDAIRTSAALVLGVAVGCRPAGATEPRTSPTLPDVGLVVHRLTAAHARAVRALGVRHVRWTWYPGDRPALDDALAVAATHGLWLTVVLTGWPPAMWGGACLAVLTHPLGGGVHAIQCGNEPDSQQLGGVPTSEPALAGVDYGALYETALAHVRAEAGLLAAARVWPAGLGGDHPGEVVRGIAAAWKHSGHVPPALCLHAYGPPMAPGLATRVQQVRAMCASLGWDVPIVCTETGIRDGELSTHPGAWAATLDTARRLQLPRVFAYCLDADADDGYSLLRADGTLTASAEWLRWYLDNPATRRAA
jgi:hypothetical protein